MSRSSHLARRASHGNLWAGYNAGMERIADKLIVFFCCLPALAEMSAGPRLVCMMLLSLICTCLCELIAQRPNSGMTEDAGAHQELDHARLALPLIWCALSCVVPDAAPFAALAAYDLACAREKPWPAVAVIAPLVAGYAYGLPAASLVAGVCVSCAAVVLSVRTARVETLHEENQRDRDNLRERSISLEEKNKDLLERREYEARLATLTERSRIARDIHDNVGHLITRAIVQVEALKVVHANDPQVEAEFSSVADTLREALNTLRQSVHGMADDACDLSVQLRHAAEEACKGTGLALSCQIAAGEASPTVVACLTSITREAISNTLRHAEGATRVRMELVEHPGFWRLSVADDGRIPTGAGDGDALSEQGRGMGLRSMEERVRALGGTLSADFSPAAGGFVVYASIPREGNDR